MSELTAAQRQRFEDEGYLIVEDVLDPVHDIRPIMDEYERVLDDLAASLLREGAIRATYADLPFAERLTQICQESGRNFPQHFDIALPQRGVTDETPIHVGPAVFRFLTNPKLLDVVESVVGPEVYSNPVQHIRMKLPKRAVAGGKYSSNVSKTAWHQDNGVILPEADVATILTVWIPLNDATLENGCLAVVPGSHRGELVTHCPSSTWGLSIPDTLVPQERAVPLPMRAGSLLLMNQRTMHCSLDNETEDQVRISFDLRYQPVGQPTGRPLFPGFVARSATQPDAVLRDPAAWARSWQDARARLAQQERDATFNRWRADAPACA